MTTSFEIDVPMKDHPVAIVVTPKEDTDNVYHLSYCDEPCGLMLCNENGVWIYEPHAHAALLFDAEHIQHLGAAIKQHQW
jgi:hypothetical protein